MVRSSEFDKLFKEIGKKNKYKVSQSNTAYPYDVGFANSSDVYSITMKIARSIQEIPYLLKIQKGDETEVVKEGELYDRLHQPNSNTSLVELKNKLALNLLLSGEFFLKNEDSIIVSKSIDSINPQLIELNTKKSEYGFEVKDYTYTGNSQDKGIHKDFITHIKLHNPTLTGLESLRGFSPLVAGFMSLKGAINNQTANASILDNQAVAGILTNENTDILTESERNPMQKVLDRMIGGAQKFGKIIQGVTASKYIPLGLTPSQLKLIESKKLTFRDLCGIYDVKPMLFSDTDGANYNNLKSAEKSFWINAVIPNDKLIMTGLQKSLMDNYNSSYGTSYFLEQDTSGILALQEDLHKEATKDKLRMDGVNVVLNMPISNEAKTLILINEYGFSHENATVIVASGSSNKVLETLQSISPLLANKIIERMTDEEIRSLLT